MNIFRQRQGQTFPQNCYFYTETINKFQYLLKDDVFKQIIVDSLKYLTERKLVSIYGYVIMPNHIHLIWYVHQMNGKESPTGSFAKFTAHQFKKKLQELDPELLHKFSVDKGDRQYQFWKRDPLAIGLTSEKNMLQKLDYIHNNPVREKWNLCRLPEDYRWSSAGFYLNGVDEFNICTHYKQ